MPYIPPKNRESLNGLIDELAKRIADESQGNDGAFAGLLNYTCTRLALKVVRIRFGEMRYWIIAILTGAFKNISDEFYRRVATPYEDKQIEKSGDVDLYEEYSREIDKL